MSGAPFTAIELAAVRGDFPILSRIGRGGNPIAYFDSAATSQKPLCVLEAEADFYQVRNGAVNRGTHLLGDEATEAFDNARSTIASFVGGRGDEIVWTKNATEALNLVARSYGDMVLSPGDRIVVTRAEHHSNLVPWQQLAARTGAELAWLDLLPDGRIDLETLGRITANTKIVAFTHMSNVTGAISPVEAIVAQARAVGAKVVLDTCQSSAHIPVDVRTLGVDFAVFSSHKMLGPTGIGALWARHQLLANMPAFLTGGSVVADVTMESAEYLPAPNRFEAGSQPVAQAVAWAVALQYMSEWGMGRIQAQESTLMPALIEAVKEAPGARILGPATAQARAGVVSFEIAGVHPHDVGQFLDAEDVAVRVGHHCAIPLHRFFGVRASSRASLSLTSTLDEIDQFARALHKVSSYFGVQA
ncbi:SufS family cysteine desulfurase [Actinomycetaceae bacterium WB03_NA08]|uniref:Cysteine desulfurase n=1 Tax=Scrofimicrobium canadense TaxID=2652290 RepID=A0A6N7W717_9ACTO|nr:SufS family cysteine desulfurase [Scrofimicrobium canadense]MSS83948.1 SufS family cysteine desulfurase [Scrofimicrobium canadense]